MKKTIEKHLLVSLFALLTTLCMIFAFVGCGETKEAQNGNNESSVSADPVASDSSGGTQPVVQMTESYSIARTQFKAVTGIELPALENVVAEEFPYEEGATSYELDMIAGVTSDTFDVMVAFLDNALSSWSKSGPSSDGGYVNIWYENTTGKIGVTWDSYNTAVYVHAIMGGNGGKEEPDDNMTAEYREARSSLYDMSGITLPKLENVTTSNTNVVFDEENGVRDEFQCEFVFASADIVSAAYAAIKSAVIAVDGQPEETSDNEYGAMDLWSVLHSDGAVPYRDDVMMNREASGTSVFMMWRKQPIVFYSVTAEGPGDADIVYTDMNYEDVYVKSYWEIADAFHGRLVATPGTGMEFVGWYVDGVSVSTDATYNFSYNGTVDFTEITFVAKFAAPAAVQMTESYAQARTAFTTATGLTLPELEAVEGMFEKIDETTYMMDINGADETVYSSVTAAFSQETGAEPYVNAYNMDTWDHSRTVEGVTYACQIRSVLDTGIVLIMCYQTAVTESYMTARQNYYEVTGLELPLLGGVEADLDYPYQSGAVSYELDIFEGATTDMFATIEKFFDGLSGWTKDEPQSDGEYTNLWYRSAGGSVGVTWDGYNNGLYIHAEMSGVIVASTYAEARQLLNETFGILLPDHENVTLEWNSFAKDGEEVTFGFSRSDFTISDFNDVKTILSAKLGAATEENDNGEYGYEVSWISGGYYYSASWDPVGKTIDINITVYGA